MRKQTDWNKYLKDIADLHELGLSSTKIAQRLLEKYPEDDIKDGNVKSIASYIRTIVCGDRLKKDFDALLLLSDKHNVDISTVRNAWIKPSPEVSFQVKNPFFVDGEEEESLQDRIDEIIKENIKREYPVQFIRDPESKFFDRLVFSDTHIGMNPDPEGISMYPTTWTREDILSRLDDMVAHVLTNARGNELYIDDLGDFLDGYEGLTTRGGHKLPQNMTTPQAFDLALEFKIALISKLIRYYSKITLNNVINDNHSGNFAYMVGSAVKQILEGKFEGVTVNNRVKFIENYSVGNHRFLLCHGKDKSLMKFAFPVKLDAKTIQKIDGYCKEYKLYSGDGLIEFSKGDSHQAIFDSSTSDDFEYFSYPSLAPQSDWISSNFKKGSSGFYFFNISYATKIRNIYPYFYER